MHFNEGSAGLAPAANYQQSDMPAFLTFTTSQLHHFAIASFPAISIRSGLSHRGIAHKSAGYDDAAGCGDLLTAPQAKIQREIENQRGLRHPNIIQLMEVIAPCFQKDWKIREMSRRQKPGAHQRFGSTTSMAEANPTSRRSLMLVPVGAPQESDGKVFVFMERSSSAARVSRKPVFRASPNAKPQSHLLSREDALRIGLKCLRRGGTGGDLFELIIARCLAPFVERHEVKTPPAQCLEWLRGAPGAPYSFSWRRI